MEAGHGNAMSMQPFNMRALHVSPTARTVTMAYLVLLVRGNVAAVGVGEA